MRVQGLIAAMVMAGGMMGPATAGASESLGSWYFHTNQTGKSGIAALGVTALGFRLAFGPNTYFDTGADLFENVRVGQGDTGRRYVANAGNDSNFNAIAALLTNGNPNDPVWHQTGVFFGTTSSAAAGRWDEQFWANKALSTAPADFSGYTLDHIDFVVDAASWEAPGSDPNGNGNWTDYVMHPHVEFFGTPVPEPTSMTLIGAGGAAALLRRRRASRG